MKEITIVGGGFSALCTAAHVISSSSERFKLNLIDPNPIYGLGIAYGTIDQTHLLNVPASNMSAFDDEPEHFYNWLKKNNLNTTPSDFYPRVIYGKYLSYILNETISKAKQKNIALNIIQDEVVDIQKSKNNQFHIKTKGSHSFHSDGLVLATGIPFKRLKLARENIIDIWPNFLHLASLAKLEESKNILIIGSGLSAIDAICSLISHKYAGKIIVLSKSGSFPQGHLSNPLPKLQGFPIELNANRAIDLLKKWKQALKQKPGKDQYWRQLVDAVRPHIPQIWHRLPSHEKKTLLRHLFSLWNKHRHCMPPSSAQLIQKLIKEKRLELISTKLISLNISNDGDLLVSLMNGTNITVSAVINCMGPDYSNQSNMLLQKLQQNKLVELNDLNLGLKPLPGKDYLIHEIPPIWALGSLLFGERLESSAVPEIRKQAQVIANEINDFIEK